jgi:hypothetical protein
VKVPSETGKIRKIFFLQRRFLNVLDHSKDDLFWDTDDEINSENQNSSYEA